jgi:fructuronate reductase/mannitol 2-dehydrogenase
LGTGPRAAQPLNDATLSRHARRVAVPTFDRWSLVPSVVHIGVGAFHRSHQAVYFDDLAERGHSREWGLVGVGLHRRGIGEALSEQDGLYTVVSRDGNRSTARIVGAMGRFLFAPDNPAAVVATLAHPRTRLVTLTVTAVAYGDRSDLGHAGSPRTAIGLLVDALGRRRRAGLRPFTVLSCDNMPSNGEITRDAVCAFACEQDPGLAKWIEAHGAFPSSMVDRITPRSTDADRELVGREFGVADLWPVITEPWSQWIVEDDFCNGRPPLDLVGAQLVGDVRPYSLMKTRMLNGAHCAIGYAGSLAGYERIDEAVQDPALGAFLDGMMGEEVAPALGPVPGIDLDAYRRSLMQRFANRGVADQLSRLCRNGSSKVPNHIVASIREAREDGRPHPRLTLAVAAWLQYLRGFDERGSELPLVDPLADRLRTLADEPRALLLKRSLFGRLAGDGTFADEVCAYLDAIERVGVREVARGLVEAPQEPLAA